LSMQVQKSWWMYEKNTWWEVQMRVWRYACMIQQIPRCMLHYGYMRVNDNEDG
jgi:hypothetical protein